MIANHLAHELRREKNKNDTFLFLKLVRRIGWP